MVGFVVMLLGSWSWSSARTGRRKRISVSPTVGGGGVGYGGAVGEGGCCSAAIGMGGLLVSLLLVRKGHGGVDSGSSEDG